MSETPGTRRDGDARRLGLAGSLFAVVPGVVTAAIVAALSGADRALGVVLVLLVPFAALSWLATEARRRIENDDDRYVLWVVGTASATSLGLLALAMFGALLKANTHHKALAGVTYAIVALGVLAGASIAGARLGGIASRWSAGGALKQRIVLALALLVVLNVVLLTLRRGELLRLDHLDALGAFVSFGAGFFLRRPERRVARGSAQP